MIAGYFGVYTAVKAGKYSMSYNVRERHWGNPLANIEESLDLFINGRTSFAQALYDAFVTCETYKCAKHYLSTAPVDTLGYIALASGANKYQEDYSQATIISRDRAGTAHFDSLPRKIGSDQWYIVATNADTWNSTVTNDQAWQVQREVKRDQDSKQLLENVSRKEITAANIYSHVLNTTEVI